MDAGAGLYMYDVVVKKFTFAISSPGEFLCISQWPNQWERTNFDPTAPKPRNRFWWNSCLYISWRLPTMQKFHFDPTMWVGSAKTQFATALKKTISGVHVSPGSTETLTERGGKTNRHSVAYSLSNISAKSY